MKVIFSELLRYWTFGDKGLIPMPRVGSHSIEFHLKHVPMRKPEQGVATIVRNPYDRLVSAYRGGLYPNMSFEDFAKTAIRQIPHDIHIRPQSEMVEAEWFGHYENFSDDWQECCEWLDIAYLPLQHMNESNRMDTEMFYTPSLRDEVAEFYRQDFETYGYSTHLEARRAESPSRRSYRRCA